DTIPDERYNFENGLPIAGRIVGVNVDSTAWGYVTRQQFIIDAFSNEPGGREKQDVGLDGMSSADEQRFFKECFMDTIEAVVNSQALQLIKQHPSAYDFDFYLGEQRYAQSSNILQRSNNFMGMLDNAPEST